MMHDSDPHRVLARNAACHQCRRRKLVRDPFPPPPACAPFRLNIHCPPACLSLFLLRGAPPSSALRIARGHETDWSQKCDAMRPTCGNCRKPRQRGPIKYEPPEPCTWDEIRDPSARTLRKRENKRRKMHELEGNAAPDGYQPYQDQRPPPPMSQQQQHSAQQQHQQQMPPAGHPYDEHSQDMNSNMC